MNASDSRPAHANTAEDRRILDAIPAIAWCKLPDASNEVVNQRWQTIRLQTRPGGRDGTAAGRQLRRALTDPPSVSILPML
jgi:hypothetical protein